MRPLEVGVSVSNVDCAAGGKANLGGGSGERGQNAYSRQYSQPVSIAGISANQSTFAVQSNSNLAQVNEHC